MNNFEKNLLNKLLDKYENSKLSKGGTSINRTIKLSTKDDVLKSYSGFDSYKYSDDNDAIIKKLESKNFIVAKFDKETFKYLTLNINNVDEIYKYLNRDRPSDELIKIKKVISKYCFNNFVDDFLKYISVYIDEKYDYPKSYFVDSNQLDLLLKIFTELFKLTEEMRKRDFSVKYLNDSKLFEKMQSKIIKIIKDFDGNEYNSDDDVLAFYNIVKNSTYALVKNKLIIKINDSIINLNDLGYELSLSDEMIKHLSLLDSQVTKVITVENLTTFYAMNNKEEVIIYLAGFHNHTKQNLLIKIYEKYPNAQYLHFGDIDVGGFLIFNNLLEKTGIPFVPFKMGVKELIENKNKLKNLTSTDKKRLNKMLTDSKFSVFSDVISYMLENNVKLEQEILD